MKVVIPTTYLRDKKIGLCPPFCEYLVCDRDIDGERSSNRPLQVSNINFRIDDTSGQQVLTKVGKLAKNGLFPHSDFRLKVTKNVLCSKYDILMRKNRRRTSDTAFESGEVTIDDEKILVNTWSTSVDSILAFGKNSSNLP